MFHECPLNRLLIPWIPRTHACDHVGDDLYSVVSTLLHDYATEKNTVDTDHFVVEYMLCECKEVENSSTIGGRLKR